MTRKQIRSCPLLMLMADQTHQAWDLMSKIMWIQTVQLSYLPDLVLHTQIFVLSLAIRPEQFGSVTKRGTGLPSDNACPSNGDDKKQPDCSKDPFGLINKMYRLYCCPGHPRNGGVRVGICHSCGRFPFLQKRMPRTIYGFFQQGPIKPNARRILNFFGAAMIWILWYANVPSLISAFFPLESI